MEDSYYVYILRCSDKTLYVGSTDNLEERLATHNQGRGAAYTFKRRPIELIYSERMENR